MARRNCLPASATCSLGLGAGKTAIETADILKISEGTVETQLKRALEKLSVSNKSDAVAKAITLGIIDIWPAGKPATLASPSGI